MYSYSKALVRETAPGSRWIEKPLADQPVVTLFNIYRDVILVVTHPTATGPLTVNLKEVADRFSGVSSEMTVQQWLASLDGESLPTTAGEPAIKSTTAKYNDAYNAGYKINLCYAEGNPFSDIPDSEKDDLIMIRPETDYQLFYESCLVTMNGLVHRTDYDINGVRVKDGGISFRKAKQNHVGIISFRELGKLGFYSITEEMLYNPHLNGKLSDAAYIKLPESVENKIVFLVLGGYLHMVDSCYHRINDQVIKVDTARLPLLNRFYESKGLIDLSKMTDHHEKNPNNPDHVSLEDFFSEESIKGYLTMSQSFIVTLEVDNLYLKRHKLGYSHLPGRYYTGLDPHWPLALQLGRLPEYVAVDESSFWNIAIQDNMSVRYIFETHEWQGEHSVDNSKISNNPVYYSQGHFLEIGTDKLVYE